MDLQRFNATSPVEDMIAAIEQDGGIVIESLISPEEVDALNRTFDPILREEKAVQAEVKKSMNRDEEMDSLMPDTMVFATNLPSRVPELARYFANDTVLDVVCGVLGTKLENITLNTSQVMESHPGSAAQPLHRDDATWPVPEPRPELCMVTLWALQNFTAEAGGTRIAPGSHSWPESRIPADYSDYVPKPSSEDREPNPDEIMELSMSAGSVLIFVGSLLHGGGNNVTTDQVRRYMHLGFCHAWLRQVENQAISLSPEQVLEFPEKIQKLLGFDEYQFELGHAYNMSPINYFKSQENKL